METEKAGGLSGKIADSNVNGCGNRFNFLTQETEFKKRSGRPTIATSGKI